MSSGFAPEIETPLSVPQRLDLEVVPNRSHLLELRNDLVTLHNLAGESDFGNTAYGWKENNESGVACYGFLPYTDGLGFSSVLTIRLASANNPAITIKIVSVDRNSTGREEWITVYTLGPDNLKPELMEVGVGKRKLSKDEQELSSMGWMHRSAHQLESDYRGLAAVVDHLFYERDLAAWAPILNQA